MTTTTTTIRYNAALKFEEWLPRRRDGFCRCGCGQRAIRVWATTECADRKVEEFQILKGNGTVIRKAVFRRDKGICRMCGLDTEAERQACNAWHHYAQDAETRARAADAAAKREAFMLRGFPSPANSWWQADHVIEVVRGGGGCDLSNFQTLCCACHSQKTAQLAADRAAERRAAKRLRLPRLPGM